MVSTLRTFGGHAGLLRSVFAWGSLFGFLLQTGQKTIRTAGDAERELMASMCELRFRPFDFSATAAAASFEPGRVRRK
jgi:hypothetical protein